MTATQTEAVGMLENERELIRKEAAPLTEAGIDVGAQDAKLEKAQTRFVEANARQEALKRALKEATAEVEAAYREMYAVGSSVLDVLIGAVGKTSASGKNFRRLRSRIRMPGDQSAASTPGGPAPGGAQ